MQSANAPSPGWLSAVFIGRRPKATLMRIAALVMVCLITFKFVLLPIRIEGISMLPTYADRQINCINRLAYLRHEPQRGDIVSVRLSKANGLADPSVAYLKRIIGLPGETVAFHDGHAFINGHLLDEPYLKLPCDWETEPFPCGPTQYYVVGDNRSMPFILHSTGRAQRDHIVGKLLFMKTAFRLVMLAAVAALGVWLWTVLFPGPEKLVRRKLASLAVTATFDAKDSNVTRAMKVGNLIGDFAVTAEINCDVPDLGNHILSGRDEIRDTARAVFAGLSALKVEFLDVTVLRADRQTADVSCTARVHAGDNKDYEVQEMHFQLKKTDGDWLITRAETVKTLQ